MADETGMSGRASAPMRPGVETAATVLGTIATTVVYMLSLTAVFGIVPTPELAGATATAPFPDATPQEHDRAR
jgi:hypothetical protein